MNFIKLFLVNLFLLTGFVFSFAQNSNKLIPSMKTSEIESITNPSQGLIIFDQDKNSFQIYEGFSWNKLSNSTIENETVRNSKDSEIFTSNTKISKADEVLFEVRDEFNVPVFTITADGARFYVKDYTAKGVSGGFAVGRYGAAKGVPDTTYFLVTPDSTRVFTKEPTGKGVSGGFAVGRYGTAKNPVVKFMQLTEDNYFIGHRSGSSIKTGVYNLFLGYESGLNAESSTSNLFLGHQSGYTNESGNDNVFIGNKTGYSLIGGYDNIFIGNLAGELSTGNTHNTFIGNEAGKNLNGDDNICIGDRSGYNQYSLPTHEFFATTIVGIDAGRNVTGDNNVVIGTGAGSSWGGTSTGSNNVYIGANAGGGGSVSRLGSNNICIGNEAGNGSTGDDKLFIDNSNTISPLIYGEFNNRFIRINGDLDVTGEICGTTYCSSDLLLKTNIVSITKPIEIIKALNGVYYDWNMTNTKNKNKSKVRQIGVIAQDVESVLPELVKLDNDGYKMVAYDKLTAVLIEGIKEQQTQINDLKEENTELRKEIQIIKTMLEPNN